MITIDPRDMDVKDWADRMSLELQPFGLIPILHDPEAWQKWAQQVILNQAISARVPPDPRFFEDWREWAIRFNQSIFSLGVV